MQTTFLLKTGHWICFPPVILAAKLLKINRMDQRNFSSWHGWSITLGQPYLWSNSKGQAHPGIGRHSTTEFQGGSLALWRDLEKPSVQLCGFWSCHLLCRCEYKHRAVMLAIAASSPDKDIMKLSFSMLRTTYQTLF